MYENVHTLELMLQEPQSRDNSLVPLSAHLRSPTGSSAGIERLNLSSQPFDYWDYRHQLVPPEIFTKATAILLVSYVQRSKYL